MHAILIADVIGGLLWATLCSLAYLMIPSADVPVIAWPFLFAMGLGCCLFAWHHPKAPGSAIRWLYYAALSPLAAVAWNVFASIAARIFFGQSEPSGSKIFDVAIALIFAPGLTIVAVLGCVRALVLTRRLEAET